MFNSKKVKNLKLISMIKVNWNRVVKGLKLLATIITTVLGTLAVQSCDLV